ncbi:MAG: class I SAM-dependent methyltransferase [Bdellovibrionia bacterium]
MPVKLQSNQKNTGQLSRISKYALYEWSVQSPVEHIDLIQRITQDLLKTPPRLMREDFCGTFLLCCEWVRRSPKNRALGIDLDSEPVEYGKTKHLSQLTPSEQKRIRLKIADVREPTLPLSDLIVVGNFSFFIFQEKRELLKYFKSCRQSMVSKGLLILEMAGGPGMIDQTQERRRMRYKNGKKMTYTWDQKSFDPIQRRAEYAIHFKFENGPSFRNAFTYDWRLWTIPELRELLREAGFKDTFVYWETEHQGEGTGEYIRMEKGDNAFSWIAYLVAQK